MSQSSAGSHLPPPPLPPPPPPLLLLPQGEVHSIWDPSQELSSSLLGPWSYFGLDQKHRAKTGGTNASFVCGSIQTPCNTRWTLRVLLKAGVGSFYDSI